MKLSIGYKDIKGPWGGGINFSRQMKKYLENIVQTTIKKYKLIGGLVIHRVGLLEPTDPIVLVATWSDHRASSFSPTRDIMESLKSEAPFWKKESTDKGFRWVQPVDKTESSNEIQ